MKRLLFYGIQVSFLMTSLYALHDWTIFNYIEADNNINTYGHNNIKSMQKVGSTDNVHLIVQLDTLNQKKTLRFKVAQGGNIEDASLNQDMGLNPEKELPEGVAWASKKYPSKYFMLILWNHGNGILDEPKGYSRIPTRGILYNYEHSTYLNNQQLECSLETIHHQVLGKKIDLLGMDACLMSMLEVCYQVKDHAQILVASENVEPAPGWNYSMFLKNLTESKVSTSPQSLAENIVHSYGLLRGFRNTNYTLSATNLNETEAIVQNLNNIIMAITKLSKIEATNLQESIQTARRSTIDFYSGKYIDLLSFYNNLTKALIKRKKSHHNELIALLTQGEQLIKNAVFSFSGKKMLPECGGLSIYYPRSKQIHSSYPLSKFAKNSLWLAFIKEYPAH